MKLIKFLFSLAIASIAVASCKTYFEGDKLKFHSEPFYRNTPSPARVDSVYNPLIR